MQGACKPWSHWTLPAELQLSLKQLLEGALVALTPQLVSNEAPVAPRIAASLSAIWQSCLCDFLHSPEFPSLEPSTSCLPARLIKVGQVSFVQKQNFAEWCCRVWRGKLSLREWFHGGNAITAPNNYLYPQNEHLRHCWEQKPSLATLPV